MAGDEYWFELIGGGLCRFGHNSDDLRLYPSSTASSSAARDSFYRGMLPFILTSRNVEALHASAIVINETVYAFCAPSGTGKSTLACACVQRGHEVWSDDALLLSSRSGVPYALSLPFYLREAKRPPAWVDLRGQANHEIELTEVEKFDPLQGVGLPLGGIFFIDRGTQECATQPSLENLSTMEAIPLLFANAYAFTELFPEQRGRLVAFYLELSLAVAVYRLRLADDLASLDSAVTLVERAIVELEA